MKPTIKNDQAVDGAKRAGSGDRQTRRVVFGLTGLLGFVWAAVIATRYASLLPN